MAKYLLDTHTAIWALLGNDEKLSAKIKGIIADKTVELAISIASAWEIAIKVSKGGKIADMSGAAVFIDKLRENGVEILGITAEEVKIIESLPFIHNDPFDRIIIATAKHNGLTLISVDENVQKYDVVCVCK
ncbi:MAG: type II toxin-antitoxin system VapC family toxin [Clostridiales Family XIII bacterium]|jgi:PIN domain nuclease of toxin-antitoxin system|nr:type II toxin-antitoxin system VapC family toxin [Clostridiales Family XIII bacterium]